MNRMDKEDWKVRLVGLQKTKFMGHLTLMPNGKLSRIERPFLTVPVTHERRLTQTNNSNLLKLAFKLKVKKNAMKAVNSSAGFSERCAYSSLEILKTWVSKALSSLISSGHTLSSSHTNISTAALLSMKSNAPKKEVSGII